MSSFNENKLVLLVVTGLFAIQTAQSAALAQTHAAPTVQNINGKSKVAPGAAASAPQVAGATSVAKAKSIAVETIDADDESDAELTAVDEWKALTAQAEERKSSGDISGAEKLFHRTYDLSKNFADDDLRKTIAAENLAAVFEREGRYTSAQAMYREAFELRKATHGESGSRMSKSHYHIGRVQMLAGEYEKARTNLKKALDLRQFSSSEESNQQDLPLILILYNLGVLETETGNFAKAEEYLHRAQSIAQHLAKHKENARIFTQLALLSLAEGDFQKAENEAHTSLSLTEKFAGSDTVLKAQALDSVAMVKLARGKLNEASELSNESWNLKRRELGLQHPLTANSLLTAGLVKLAEKKYEAAEKTFNDAIDVYSSSISQSHLSYSRALMGRAFANLKQKDNAASKHDMEEAKRLMTGTSSQLSSKYNQLYIEHLGPNFNLFEMLKEKVKTPNAVAEGKFDSFGQLLEIAVDDGDSDEMFAGVKYKDVFAVLGVTFIVILMLAMAVLIPGAFSRLFPWGRKADDDDHAAMRNKNRKTQASGQYPVVNQQQKQQQPESTLRGSTDMERRQVQLWKGHIKTMEQDLPKPVKESGAYERIDFKPSSQQGSSTPVVRPHDLSTPVQPEGSNEQYW